MLANQTFTDRVIDVIGRHPDHVWVEPGMALLGWGIAQRLEVGTGPERYCRAHDAVRSAGHRVVFASFTFDDEEPGSFVVVPATVAKVTQDDFEMIRGDLPPSPGPSNELPNVVGAPRLADGWREGFDTAMAALRDTTLEKVVLSRTVEISFDRDLLPAPVVAGLVRDQERSFVFAADGLVGSSPELLARLEGTRVRSVSLAGSMSKSGGNGALSSAKNRREHELAAESVAAALAPVTSTLDRGDAHEASFADIVHLATVFEGETEPGVTVLDLIERLHPTAAVAGTPTKAAADLIREIEAHRRGRYAGPVGWFDSSGDGTFAIALRCGQIRGRDITLYTGAGLVEGSEEGAEYAETEIKLMPMLRSLGLS